MRFIPVDKLPEKAQKKTHHKDLEKLLADFMNGKDDIVLVDFDEDDYSATEFCRSALRYAIANYNYPVKICYRSSRLYLVKTA